MSYWKIAFGVVALLPSLTLRAQLQPPAQSLAVQAIQAKSRVAEADKTLASWLMAGCDNEVAIARIALEKSQNAEVKLFAQKMLEDHAQLATKLLPFAGADAKVGGIAPVPTKDADPAKAAVREPAEASSDRSQGAKKEFDHIALIRDLSRRCFESQAKTLEAKSGADFDRSFMQAQVVMHTQAVIMVEVFSDYASGDLRPTLALAGKTLRAHLERATPLCKKCDDGAKASTPLSNQQ